MENDTLNDVKSDTENPFAQMVESAKRELEAGNGSQAQISELSSRVAALESIIEKLKANAIGTRPCDA